jgi:hypothetical protein
MGTQLTIERTQGKRYETTTASEKKVAASTLVKTEAVPALQKEALNIERIGRDVIGAGVAGNRNLIEYNNRQEEYVLTKIAGDKSNDNYAFSSVPSSSMSTTSKNNGKKKAIRSP